MIKYKIIRNKNIKNNQILGISKLKDSFWPYGIKNQKKFLRSNTNINDLHILAYKNKNIVGYVNLKIKLFIKNDNIKKNKFFLFDGFIVDKLFRKVNIGRNIVRICKKKSKSEKIPIFLLCKRSVMPFYKKLNFKIIPKKKYHLLNHRYKGLLLQYNFNSKKINPIKIIF
tara:strand:+ start:210 stop:719 length:510 start_codon:yes stop_codon:yes gene_type:complete